MKKQNKNYQNARFIDKKTENQQSDAGRGVSEKVWAVGFWLGSGLFGSCNSD